MTESLAEGFGDGVNDVVTLLDEAKLSDHVESLVLAALLDPDLLADNDGAISIARPVPSKRNASMVPQTFLASLSVSGFRGVGKSSVKLELSPEPGLVVVTGRNGSGKSSLAEALELLLTGVSDRWAERSVAWRDAWQHLDAESTDITANFAVEGYPGLVEIRQTITGRVKPDQAPMATVKLPGQAVMKISDTEWANAASTFRPFLSYNELGGLLEGKNINQYRAIASVLDLGALEQAAGTLRQARLNAEKTQTEVDRDRKTLAAAAEQIVEPRAQQLVPLLTARKLNLAAIDLLLSGESTDLADATLIASLAGLSTVVGPDAVAVLASVDSLVAAKGAWGAVQKTDAGRSHELASLLDRALALHASHGDRSCPVCGEGRLDNAWTLSATSQRNALVEETKELAAADSAVKVARAELTQRLGRPPKQLHAIEQLPGDLVDLVERSSDAWTNLLTAEPTLVQSTIETMCADLRQVRELAATILKERQDLWGPVHRGLAAWRHSQGDPAVRADRVKNLKTAETFMKDAINSVRTKRFGPLQQAATEVWGMLRRDSNITLDQVTLTGSGSNQGMSLSLEVDGKHKTGIGVLSQGEIHSMALALFLPRATLAASPFRFLVIDDPVQAMDPGKVEALAQVLHRSSKDRQIIVFTHDERLPEALRRLQLAARMFEVRRSVDGEMTVVKGMEPVERALSDASALLKSNLPDQVAQRVVPNFCRAAIEAACDEVIRRTKLSAGERHVDVENTILDARTLNQRMALAIFNEAGRSGEVGARLNQVSKSFGDAVGEANRGSHHGVSQAQLGKIRDDTRGLCKWLRSQ